MPRLPTSSRPPARPAGSGAARGGLPRLDTERFYLRALTPADASERWVAWLGDSEVMGPINTRLRQPSLAQLRAHIASHDQVRRLFVGIFDRSQDRHIGFYRIDLDPKHGLATFNVLIGDKAYWGRRTVLETRAALLDHLFRRMGIEKAVGMPLARNFPAIFNYRAQGWSLEGVLKAHRAAADGSGRLDQLVFGLTKAAWIARRKENG